jgi:glycine hydroxymethyltransferase
LFQEALSDDFKTYAQQILKNAKALADSFTNEGLRVVSGGTVNHIVLVDTQSVDEELTGKEAGILLNEMGITLNRNAIPFDTRSPFVTSGIRMGTPAVTTCGMKEEQLTTVGLLISDILKNRNDENQLSNLKAQVRDLAITHQPYA